MNNGETPHTVISNYVTTHSVPLPKPLNQIVDDVHRATGGWPRRVGAVPFVDDEAGLRWFDRERAAGIFAWLKSRFPVEWKSGGSFVSSMEFFSQLSHVARQYAAIEQLPHEPLIDDIYYRCESPPTGDGTHLEQLLDRFRPATPQDRCLIQAAIMTAFWGGTPGMRPAFVITSDDGRGVGKSKLADAIAYLAGGAIDVDAGCDITELKQRLLSPEGLTKRIAVLDNIKSLRFSWAELEKLITAREISGKAMYIGEARRPNLLTWFITLNGLAMGDDMAQRSVIIKVVRGENSGTWFEDTIRFIDEHRQQIIGDVIAALRSGRKRLAHHSRWAAWEHDVLSRLPRPDELQRLIVDRQSESNCELDEADLVEELFAEQLELQGFDPAACTVHIPASTASQWFGQAMGEKLSVPKASKRLNQLASEKRNQTAEGKLRRLRANPCRKYGRGYVWSGENSAPGDPVDYSLAKSHGRHPDRRSADNAEVCF